jgi:hypothetical protein
LGECSAAPDRIFVHLAIQEARVDGNEAQWFEHVTEEEYHHPIVDGGSGD